MTECTLEDGLVVVAAHGLEAREPKDKNSMRSQLHAWSKDRHRRTTQAQEEKSDWRWAERRALSWGLSEKDAETEILKRVV